MNGRERIGDHIEMGGDDKLAIIYMNKAKRMINLMTAIYFN